VHVQLGRHRLERRKLIVSEPLREQLADPARVNRAVDSRRSLPAGVSDTTTPRLSSSALQRDTRPSSTSRATRRVMPDREISVLFASSVMPSRPPRERELREDVEIGECQAGL